MIRHLISLLVLLVWNQAAAGPLLTGVVEDVKAQTIEMPSLPGAWQRRIEWMAPEGSEVATGEMVVRLDPGDLIWQEDQARTELEKQRLSAARRIDELKLELLDAERELARAESAVRLAEMDAVIPASTIPRLDYERYQLTLETTGKARIRAQAVLLNKRVELEDVSEETRLEVRKAQASYERISNALKATQITAEKPGFIIYGDNRFTGRKVFPGETLYSGFEVAAIASREDLQVRFWVHEADSLKVRIGQRVAVVADAQGAIPFEAVVSWTSSQATEKQDWSDSGYFEAYAKPVSGMPEGVMPGMSVMGEVVAGEAEP
jgi:multidrug resistance efflux pump